MLNKWMNVASLIALVSCASLAHAQALPTATARGALQVGIGWSYVTPDYAQNIQGVTGYADFDFLTHFGVEAEYHYIGLVTPGDIAENSIFIGPRFLLPRGRYNYYAKILVGDGDIVNQLQARSSLDGEGTHKAYALGVGVDYRATRHIVARADFEYQHWSYKDGLTPKAITVGLAYHFR